MTRLKADTGHLGSEKAVFPVPERNGRGVQKREGIEASPGCELAVFEICLHSLAVYLGTAMSERLVCSAAVGRADAFSEPKEGSDGVLTLSCWIVSNSVPGSLPLLFRPD